MQITLNSPWFDLVKSGRKIYEGRRCTEKMKALKPGDELIVAHHTDPTAESFSITVLEILHFPTFEAALKSLPVEQVLVAGTTVAEGVEIYKRYVSLPTQERDGVVMLKIRLTD